MPSRPLRLLLLACLAGLPLLAQSYQTSFTENKFDRAEAPLIYHSGVQVDPATGAASLDYPIGPGIGARGVVYRPHLSGRWAPQIQGETVVATIVGSGSPVIQYGLASNQASLTNIGGFSFTPGQFDLILDSGGPGPSPTQLIWLPSLPAVSSGILPDGQTITSMDATDTIDTSDTALPIAPAPTLQQIQGSLLPSFKLDGYQVAGLPALGTALSTTPMICRGTKDEIIIGLTSSNAPTRNLPCAVSVPVLVGGEITYYSVPDRILVVVGDIAYEFTYAVPVFWPGVAVSSTGSAAPSNQPPSLQMIQTPYIEQIRSALYRLERISNRFGDEILFNYQTTSASTSASSVTAVWNRYGVAVGPSIQVQAYPLSVTYSGGPKNLTLTTTGMAQTLGSSGAESMPAGLGQLAASSTYSRPFIDNCDFKIDSFSLMGDDGYSYSASFTYAPVTFFGNIPSPSSSQNPGAGGGQLLTVTSPGSFVNLTWDYFQYRRNFGGGGYIQAHYPEAGSTGVLDGNNLPMYFQGVTKVDEQDTSSVTNPTTRTTTYTRHVPRPNLTAGHTNNWLSTDGSPSTDFWVTVTHPDSSQTKFIYYSPLDGSFGDSSCSKSDQFQTLAHLKHVVHQEIHYAPDHTTVVKTIDNGAPSTLSMNTLCNPKADSALSIWDQGSPVPYATAQTLTDNLTGVVETAGLQNWCGYAWNNKNDNEIANTTQGNIYHNTVYTWSFDPTTWSGPLATHEQRDGLPSCDTTYDAKNRPWTKTYNKGGTPALTVKNDYSTSDSAGTPNTCPDSVTLTGTGATGTAGVSYGFDGYGLVNSISVSGVQGTLGETHDAYLRTISQTDLNGFTKTIGWDSLGRLTSLTPPNSEWPTTITYDPDHLGAKVTHGSSNTTSYRYNGFGELVSIQKPTLETKTFHYDLGGRKTFESIYGSTTAGTTLAYVDPAFRLTSITDANGVQSSTTYSGATRTVTTGGSATAFTEGVYGRTTDIVDALGQLTHYDFDPGDRISTVSQYTGATATGTKQVRSWYYNQIGWLTSLVQPESGTTSYTNFTVLGKPGTTNYANGSVLTTTYDVSGRVTAVTSPGTLQVGGVNQAFTWDGGSPFNGKIHSSSDGNTSLAYTYLGLNGRLDTLTMTQASVQGAVLPPFAQSFQYDLSGLRSSATLPNGRALTYGFDLSRELTSSVSGNGGAPGAFTPAGPFGQLQNFNAEYSPGLLTFVNGVATTQFTYGNDLARLGSMTHIKTGVNAFTKVWTYDYDAHGWMTNDEDAYPNNPSDQPYKFDTLGRLISAKMRILSGQDVTQTFTYDAFGNRLSSVVDRVALPVGPIQNNFTNVTFNASDLVATNGIPAFTNLGVATGAVYDAAGNLAQILKQAGAPSRLVTLTYDTLGRIIGMADQENATTEYYYYTPEGLRTRIETYQGLPPGGLKLTKVKLMIYNDQRQLVSQYELVQE